MSITIPIESRHTKKSNLPDLDASFLHLSNGQSFSSFNVLLRCCCLGCRLRMLVILIQNSVCHYTHSLYFFSSSLPLRPRLVSFSLSYPSSNRLSQPKGEWLLMIIVYFVLPIHK